MPRNPRQHLPRIKYLGTGENRVGQIDINDQPTRELLHHNEASSFTKDEVMAKLNDYVLLLDKDNTSPKNWIRYINRNDGILRVGGFPIKNTEKYIVLKNPSKTTFNIQKEDVILFEKRSKDNTAKMSDKVFSLLSLYKQSNGSQFVLVDDDFKNVFSGSDIKRLSQATPASSITGLRKAFRKDNDKYKNFFLFKLSPENVESLKEDIGNLTDADRQVQEEEEKSNRLDDIEEVVSQFYS